MLPDDTVVMLADATATLTEAEHVAMLERIIAVSGDVPTVDEALARLSP